MTFAELLDEIRVGDLDALTHADIPFESLVDALAPSRSEAFAPLAQVMLTFDQSALPELGSAASEIVLDGLVITPVQTPQLPAKLDLTVSVAVSDDAAPWPASVLYAADLFDGATIGEFGERLVTLLRAMVDRPGIVAADVELTSTEEKAQINSWAVGRSVDIPDSTLASGMEDRR